MVRRDATLPALEEVEISFTAHSGRTEEVLDDEHGDFRVDGDHERSFHSGFGVNEMGAVLPVEGEAVQFEDSGERPVAGGVGRGRDIYFTLMVNRSRDTNSGVRHISPSRS
jgi:hypothetical protein